MSWTDVFPMLTDEMVSHFRANASPVELREIDEWIDIESIHRPRKQLSQQKSKSIVSTTLFWKHASADDPELPTPSFERLVLAKRFGLVKRFAPWSTYIEPIVIHGQAACQRHPDTIFRIYLANDLHFLIERFIDIGWEVVLMKSSSIRFCPGALWRFLALEERAKAVTMIDADRIGDVDGDIARTQMMSALKLGLWRVPGYYSADNSAKAERIRYRPLLAGHFGGIGGLPIRELLSAFIWHIRRGSISFEADVPGRGKVPLFFTKWPDYGVDEWFLMAAVYPRMVLRGSLTFLPSSGLSMFVPLDVEFATWANRRSEIVYF